MDYFLPVFFFCETIWVFLVALLIPLCYVASSHRPRLVLGLRSLRDGCRDLVRSVSKRGNKTLTRAGCDCIKEGWLYSRWAIWKLTGNLFCMLRFASLFVVFGVNFSIVLNLERHGMPMPSVLGVFTDWCFYSKLNFLTLFYKNKALILQTGKNKISLFINLYLTCLIIKLN